MAPEMNHPEAATHGTLALLETRLHRLEFLVAGASNDEGYPGQTTKHPPNTETLWAKLDALEAELAGLKKAGGAAGTVIQDIEQLCRRSTLSALEL